MVNDRLNGKDLTGSSCRSVPSDQPKQQRATRLAFALLGIGMAAWAPLVPFAKLRLGADEATLGGMLLCLGIGSFVAMPVAGFLAGRIGCRRVICAGAIGLCLALPGLATANTVVSLAAVLLWFGVALGLFDVAVNVQAVTVEAASGRAMMSGFHAFFSLGGMIGAGGVSLLLWLGTSPRQAACSAAAACLLALFVAAPGLVPRASETGRRTRFFLRPSGLVLGIGCLCFVAFLTEGAILDWSGIFLVAARGVSRAGAGLGYAVFSIAMAIGRLAGDRIVFALGRRGILAGGALLAVAGLGLVITVAQSSVSLLGFAMVGSGAANIVPILYSALGRQNAMPANLAVSAASTLGYAGILAGPAMIGWVANLYSLKVGFGLVAILLLLVALCARRVIPAGS